MVNSLGEPYGWLRKMRDLLTLQGIVQEEVAALPVGECAVQSKDGSIVSIKITADKKVMALKKTAEDGRSELVLTSDLHQTSETKILGRSPSERSVTVKNDF